jgi:hypothetical protein
MSFDDIMCNLMYFFHFFSYGTLFLSKGGERFLMGAIACNFSFFIQLYESKITQKIVKCNI